VLFLKLLFIADLDIKFVFFSFSKNRPGAYVVQVSQALTEICQSGILSNTYLY